MYSNVVSIWTIWLMFCLTIQLFQAHSTPPSTAKEFLATLPGATTTKDDTYVCFSWKPPFNNVRYITSFAVLPASPHVHHFIVNACSGDLKESSIMRDCKCKNSRIYYAWARNAPETVLPDGAAFVLGSSEASYLSLQVHFKTAVSTPDYTSLKLTISETPRPFTAGVLISLLDYIDFPPNTAQIMANISCQFMDDDDIVPFGFRTHTHTHGRVLTGYVYRAGEWILIGKGNPLWPQTFWPVQTKDLKITKNDYIIVRAVYSTLNETEPLNIGSTHMDEMCNFYIMYYRNASVSPGMSSCDGDNYPAISAKIPVWANELLPPNKTLDSMGTMMHHQQQDHTTSLSIEPVAGWPLLPDGLKLGQVTGVSMDALGFLYAFHRGSTIWDDKTFNKNNVYALNRKSPILDKTIVKIQSNTGSIVSQAGQGFFFVPHGIYVDSKGFVWLTDVGMHQVFKFSADIFDGALMKPLLTLGTSFEPGSDQKHFCQPTAVVVEEGGQVYVSDGYCNQRVVVFDEHGGYLREIKLGDADHFQTLPHSLSLDQNNHLLYVTDRSSLTILVHKTDGVYVKTIKVAEFKNELFACHYNPFTEFLFCVDGNIINFIEPYYPSLFIIDPHNSTLVSTWPLPLSNSILGTPHDITVSTNASSIFVSYIGQPGSILKYNPPSMAFHSPSYHRKIITTLLHSGSQTLPSMASAALVVMCLMLIPLLIIIGAIIYVRNRQHAHEFQYTQLRNRDVKRGMNEVNDREELKKLSALSEDDDEDEDAFDAAVYSRKLNKL